MGKKAGYSTTRSAGRREGKSRNIFKTASSWLNPLLAGGVKLFIKFKAATCEVCKTPTRLVPSLRSERTYVRFCSKACRRARHAHYRRAVA